MCRLSTLLVPAEPYGPLDFVIRMRNCAPCNAMLLVQKTGLGYAAMATVREQSFGRRNID